MNNHWRGKTLFPGLFSNIRKLSDEAADTIPICMKDVMDKAVGDFAVIQKTTDSPTASKA